MLERTTIERISDLDLLSAIWILSCNDENPITTYYGLRERLLVPNDVDIKSLVLGRRELFRPGLPKERLEEWKDRLRARKEVPSWLAAVQDAEKRGEMIDALSSADVFRNQFRTGKNAAPCDLKIVDWGLQHLDRLRKAASELRAERLTRRTSLIVPLVSVSLSAVVAIASLIGAFAAQSKSSADQFAIKRYEMTIKPRQESYANFMAAFTEAYQAAFKRDEERTRAFLANMESGYYKMEPFLGDKRQEVSLKFMQFSSFCFELVKSPAPTKTDLSKANPQDYNDAAKALSFYRSYFNDTLYKTLF
jgi:hypothetical protein